MIEDTADPTIGQIEGEPIQKAFREREARRQELVETFHLQRSEYGSDQVRYERDLRTKLERIFAQRISALKDYQGRRPHLIDRVTMESIRTSDKKAMYELRAMEKARSIVTGKAGKLNQNDGEVFHDALTSIYEEYLVMNEEWKNNTPGKGTLKHQRRIGELDFYRQEAVRKVKFAEVKAAAWAVQPLVNLDEMNPAQRIKATSQAASDLAPSLPLSNLPKWKPATAK